MGFWIFILIMTLLLPAFQIIYGNIHRNKAPEDIQGTNGYKTARSRLNRDTWEFANCYYDRLMCIAGWGMLVLSPAAMLFVLGKNTDTVCSTGLLVIMAELVLLLICAVPTERALKRTFDEFGNRK
jgi:hypothetical protein